MCVCVCVVRLGTARSKCDIPAFYLFIFFKNYNCFFCSWELLAAAGEERKVPGALHARDDQGGVLSEWTAGDVLDRGGRPQQHAL